MQIDLPKIDFGDFEGGLGGAREAPRNCQGGLGAASEAPGTLSFSQTPFGPVLLCFFLKIFIFRETD